jgi:hypothetical protein
MRRILLLAATMTLALVLVGGVAISKQPPPTSDKGSGSIPRSTVVKASFANGSGANFLGVKVSDHGNLTSFESPAGQEQVFAGNEGYAVCSGSGLTVHGHDTGSVVGGFAAPTFSQPTVGAFPLTVTRRTTDGKFQLTQVWAKPDPVEKDVTVTMTLKNISGAPINTNVLLSRSGDFDIGNSTNSSTDRGAATDDSVWLWDDISTGEPGGVMLTALTFGTDRRTRVEVAGVWGDPVSGSRTKCLFPSETTPTNPAGDFAMGMTYVLGTFNAGQSKTAKYVYGRM